MQTLKALLLSLALCDGFRLPSAGSLTATSHRRAPPAQANLFESLGKIAGGPMHVLLQSPRHFVTAHTCPCVLA